MPIFTCSTCRKEWPENYCPQCARTIERAQVPQPRREAISASVRIEPVPTGRLTTWQRINHIGVRFIEVLFLFLMGVLLFYYQVMADWEHHLLKTAGQKTTGTLRMVTNHRVNFIPTGSDFDVEYLGQRKTFDVNSGLFAKHTLPDGTFIPHTLEVVYLPDRPQVAELPEMLGTSRWWRYLFGIALVFGAGITLRQSIRSWRAS